MSSHVLFASSPSILGFCWQIHHSINRISFADCCCAEQSRWLWSWLLRPFLSLWVFRITCIILMMMASIMVTTAPRESSLAMTPQASSYLAMVPRASSHLPMAPQASSHLCDTSWISAAFIAAFIASFAVSFTASIAASFAASCVVFLIAWFVFSRRGLSQLSCWRSSRSSWCSSLYSYTIAQHSSCSSWSSWRSSRRLCTIECRSWRSFAVAFIAFIVSWCVV